MAGMPLATARAMLPALEVIDADPVADATTLNAIADWCDRFTPLVALDGEAGLLLDITGCAHLFGGEAQMLTKVCDGLSRQGFIVSGAIAGTSVAARALTRHVHGRIVACGREAAAVAPLAGRLARGRRKDRARAHPRRPEDHRRCRRATACGNHRAVWRGIHRDAAAGAGAGRYADLAAQARAGLHGREAVRRTGRNRRMRSRWRCRRWPQC